MSTTHSNHSPRPIGDRLVEFSSSYCLSWRLAAETNNIKGWRIVPTQCLRHVEAYILGMQYDSDLNLIVDQISSYIDEIVVCDDGLDAWVLDVDDTCLSNIFYYQRKRFGCDPYDPQAFKEWASRGEAKVPTVSSNPRIVCQADPTRNEAYKGQSGIIYKSEMRRKLMEEGYRIWGNVGDQWSDLHGQFNGSSIADYYHKLNALWKQYDAMIELPKCVCNASENSILSREVLPDVRSAYAITSSEEYHRVAAGSIAGSSQRNHASAFVFISKKSNFWFHSKELGLVCENCDFNGDTIDKCFMIIGLYNGLTLYDVMVIPEYCVTLISVHNLAKEIKVIVAFNENRCYFLNHDLSLKIFLGIGDQCEELYYYNNQVDNSGNDADRSDDLVATQNEEVATLEKNIVLRIDRYKARLVAQGFGQKDGIDYEETFFSIVKMVTVRCLLNIDVCMSWLVFQLDVNNDFLYGDLEEVVYMKPPEGYFSSDNKVCRLKKSLYGLKQAPRQGNAKLTFTLIENGFSQSKSDYSLYTKSDKGVFLALLVYVDDIIITGNSSSEIEKFKVFLKSKFMIKDLGKLKYFLEIEVVDTDKGICLNQRKYVPDLLSEYGMLACKPAKTLLMSKLVICNEASKNDHLLENVTDYQKLMRTLIYLTNTRPDISYVVHCLSQFMHSPLSSHLKIAFKILRYLKSCPGLGFHIARTSGMFLNAYSDTDWANKKQNTISKSSTEAEYRALASVTTIKIAVSPVFHERTKHLEIDLHFVREIFLKGVVRTVKVDSANQIADILTKGLDTFQHMKLVKRLGMYDVYQVEAKGRY
ncbi:ribonuclease H-like domain-containing protein [Tanacetum coccineum]